jgi:hypothetical protein
LNIFNLARSLTECEGYIKRGKTMQRKQHMILLNSKEDAVWTQAAQVELRGKYQLGRRMLLG